MRSKDRQERHGKLSPIILNDHDRIVPSGRCVVCFYRVPVDVIVCGECATQLERNLVGAVA
jgi:hypothetical protein